jgi:hypothetical protein
MITNKPISLKELKDKINSDKYLKTAVYIGIGVVSLYILGKVLSTMASTVRGYNELKSALKGN